MRIAGDVDRDNHQMKERAIRGNDSDIHAHTRAGLIP
jgi:hypothetical protein